MQTSREGARYSVRDIARHSGVHESGRGFDGTGKCMRWARTFVCICICMILHVYISRAQVGMHVDVILYMFVVGLLLLLCARFRVRMRGHVLVFRYS